MSDRTSLTCDEIRDLAPLFVTGALDPDEMDAVREHLADCDDAHAEVMELGEAATALLESVEPVDPPASIKPRLMAAAAADLAAGRHPSTAASAIATAPAAAPVPAPPAETPVRRPARGRRRRRRPPRRHPRRSTSRPSGSGGVRASRGSSPRPP